VQPRIEDELFPNIRRLLKQPPIAENLFLERRLSRAREARRAAVFNP
jgi:hypothetical protein